MPAAADNKLSVDQTIDELVIANHILFDQGVVDAFGHISVRNPERSDRYFLAKNVAPASVTRGDIIEFDLDSNPAAGETRSVYLERFIHGEIYRSRPDVNAVVHSHSPTIVPFSVVPSVKLQPVCHMSGFLCKGVPSFDIKEAAGDGTDLLIRNRELGVALAKSLDTSLIVLMRGHGSTVVGGTIKQVVYRAVYAEINAKLQAEALRLGGPVTYLTSSEAAAAFQNVETQLQRPWDLWAARVSGR